MNFEIDSAQADTVATIIDGAGFTASQAADTLKRAEMRLFTAVRTPGVSESFVAAAARMFTAASTLNASAESLREAATRFLDSGPLDGLTVLPRVMAEYRNYRANEDHYLAMHKAYRTTPEGENFGV